MSKDSKYLRLREVMTEKGITGKDLAKKVGVAEISISAIVTGKSQPRFELLEKIANVLDVRFIDLFKDVDTTPFYIKEDGHYKEIGQIRFFPDKKTK